MKLLRYSDGKLVKPGILDDAGKIRDVSLAVKDWSGTTINDGIINRIKNNILHLPGGFSLKLSGIPFCKDTIWKGAF